jgi:hypothetical protein
MLEIHDYSNRRGVLVPFLPKIHKLLTETANMDKSAGIEPPVNFIIWRQEYGKRLVEVNRRWLVALDGSLLVGVFFFHFLNESEIYLDELRVAHKYRNHNAVITLFHDRFVSDFAVKKVTAVFAGPTIKKESHQEKLAAVGFGEHYENEREPLGEPAKAAAELKRRYLRI